MTTCAAIRADLDLYLAHALPVDRHAAIRDHLNICPSCWNSWNRHRWDRAAGTPLMDEFRTYLHEHDEPYTPYRDSSRELAATWDHAVAAGFNRATFFRASTAYLYNLVIWEASGNRPNYLSAATPLLAELGTQVVMDIGCGIGSDTLALRALGYTVIPVDYTSPTTHFTQWRMHRHGHLPTDQHIYEPGDPMPTTPDTLWIIDTLDHVPDLHTQLGPHLATARHLIHETPNPARPHGPNAYYLRRAPEDLHTTFTHYGLSPHPLAPDSPITLWTRRPL